MWEARWGVGDVTMQDVQGEQEIAGVNKLASGEP
jgi:hypothetical protein